MTLPLAPDDCPFCDAKWDVAEIPEKDRVLYCDRVRFNRAITVIDTTTNKQTAWLCPDCLTKLQVKP